MEDQRPSLTLKRELMSRSQVVGMKDDYAKSNAAFEQKEEVLHPSGLAQTVQPLYKIPKAYSSKATRRTAVQIHK